MVMRFTNNATTTLASGITNSATSLTVATSTGSLFPALSVGDYFYCTLANVAGTVEIIQVTARSTDTFTIVRGQDNTSGLAWNAGDKVELRIVAANLNDLPKLDQANAFTGANTHSGAESFSTSITLPSLSSAPATPSSGNLYFNSVTGQWQGYNGSTWAQVGGGALGGTNTNGGTDSIFNECDNVVTGTWTLGQDAYVSGVTVTLASPGVFTLANHGYVQDQQVHFKTTGALPTGLAVDTVYYVISAGLTTNAFEVSTTVGGSAVNTSGSQSGTHSVGKIRSAVVPSGFTVGTTGSITIPTGASLVIAG